MRVYLAHPISYYDGTPTQVAAVKAINERGWQVENPDQPHHQAGYKERGMDHFIDVVQNCDGLAFIRFPDGAIGAGVAKEIEAALRQRKPLYDATSGQLTIQGEMMPFPVLSVEETRARITAWRAATAPAIAASAGEQPPVMLEVR